jgi:hypothetical protein
MHEATRQIHRVFGRVSARGVTLQLLQKLIIPRYTSIPIRRRILESLVVVVVVVARDLMASSCFNLTAYPVPRPIPRRRHKEDPPLQGGPSREIPNVCFPVQGRKHATILHRGITSIADHSVAFRNAIDAASGWQRRGTNPPRSSEPRETRIDDCVIPAGGGGPLNGPRATSRR